MIRDEHILVTEGALDSGACMLSVGMYGFPSGARLTAVGPDGAHLPEDRIPLQEIRVVPP